MDLTTRARVLVHLNSKGQRTRIDPTDSDDPTAAYLDELIAYWSAKAERYLNRKVQRSTRTEYFDVESHQRVFSLKAYPVTNISSVTYDETRGFSSGTIDSDEYSCQTGNGLLRITDYWMAPEPGALRVIYTGGMAPSAASFVTAYPEIAGAIDLQVVYHDSRRGREGKESVSMGQGSVSFTSALDWLPHVRRTLDEYRRFSFGR